MNTQNFKEWLDRKDLSESSKSKYKGVPNLIDNLLRSHGYSYDRIYDISNPEFITEIVSVPEVKAKSDRENRTISSGLKHYKELLEWLISTEMIEDEIIAQEIEEMLSNSKKKKKRIRDSSEPVPPIVSGSRAQHRRDNGKAVQAIIQADFECESDKSHKFFNSKKTGENYCETHHLIPMRLQKRFPVSLDVYSNLVSLCPVCHRALHHGHINDKRAILERLYNEREERLIASGIIIKFDEVLDVYK